jgi:dienelactone hydrolase
MHVQRTRAGALLFLAAVLAARGLADQPAPLYQEHQNLGYYLDELGERRAVRSVVDWQRRRQHILAHMQQVMGPLPDRAKYPALEVAQLEEVKLPGLTRRKLRYRVDLHDQVSAYLFLPAPLPNQKLPAILCLHQTIRIGKEEPSGLGGNPNLHYALHLVQRGYVTLAPDYPSFGEHDYDFAIPRGYGSGTMKAISDNIRALDLLQSLPEVDPERLGCIGHSLGGHNTMFTAAFDERIKVLVSNCGFTRFHKYYDGKLAGWTSPRYMPKIAEVYGNDPDRVPFDFTEIVAAFAPRPFLASAPVRDGNFEVSGVQDVIAAARPIYALYGKVDHLQANYPESEHDFPADAREAAYAFFDKYLKSGSP